MNATANLADDEKQAIQEFKDKIISLYPNRVSLIELFGSKARGSSSKESDIDILLLIDKDNMQTSWDISKLESELLLKYGVLISSTIIAKDHYRKLTDLQTGLVKNIKRDGIELWKATS